MWLVCIQIITTKDKQVNYYAKIQITPIRPVYVTVTLFAATRQYYNREKKKRQINHDYRRKKIGSCVDVKSKLKNNINWHL